MTTKDFKQDSKKFIQDILKNKVITMRELADLINEYYGYEKYTTNAIKMKISRGQFNFPFFLEVCEVLNIDVNLEYK